MPNLVLSHFGGGGGGGWVPKIKVPQNSLKHILFFWNFWNLMKFLKFHKATNQANNQPTNQPHIRTYAQRPQWPDTSLRSLRRHDQKLSCKYSNCLSIAKLLPTLRRHLAVCRLLLRKIFFSEFVQSCRINMTAPLPLGACSPWARGQGLSYWFALAQDRQAPRGRDVSQTGEGCTLRWYPWFPALSQEGDGVKFILQLWTNWLRISSAVSWHSSVSVRYWGISSFPTKLVTEQKVTL